MVRERPAGDFDYERGGEGYASIRRPDPRFARRVREAFGDARTLINVGAGAGSYEPTDLEVTAVEPSAMMRAQRPATLAPAIDAIAEDLPFPDDSFDAGMASVTIHQWRELDKGLRELRRVTSGPVVILTFDPHALRHFWLAHYAPELMERETGRMPPIESVTSLLGGRSVVERVPLPADCTDGFGEAFFGRPEAFLDENVRRAQSAWGFIDDTLERQSIARLDQALNEGSWDERYGALRTMEQYEGSLRLISARRD